MWSGSLLHFLHSRIPFIALLYIIISSAIGTRRLHIMYKSGSFTTDVHSRLPFITLQLSTSIGTGRWNMQCGSFTVCTHAFHSSLCFTSFKRYWYRSVKRVSLAASLLMCTYVYHSLRYDCQHPLLQDVKHVIWQLHPLHSGIPFRLKRIPTQQDITTFHCSLSVLASINKWW